MMKFVALAALVLPGVHGFGFDPNLIHQATNHAVHHAVNHHTHHVAAGHGHTDVLGIQTAVKTLTQQAQHVGSDMLSNYKQCLKSFPLQTKMVTGATLAVCGDAIAQSKAQRDAAAQQQPVEPYDQPRAASFAVFDSAYRALQHVSFPVITQHCHGQVLGGGLAAVLAIANSGVSHADTLSYAAAMEQTLASQLGIVPFLYYPAFFTLTALVQGLNSEHALERAKTNFLPLMKRNLMFWIPVQFVQFQYVPEDLQVPFLSVCGLAWTFILSVSAGSAKKPSTVVATANTADNVVIEPEELLAESAAQAIVMEEQELVVNVEGVPTTADSNLVPSTAEVR